MYDEPLLSENLVSEGGAIEDFNNDSNVDANDRTSQDLNKSKKEEDEENNLKSGRLIVRWGLVFTFFR